MPFVPPQRWGWRAVVKHLDSGLLLCGTRQAMQTAVGKEGVITGSQFRLTSGSVALWQFGWSKVTHNKQSSLLSPSLSLCVFIVKVDISSPSQKLISWIKMGTSQKSTFVMFWMSTYMFSVGRTASSVWHASSAGCPVQTGPPSFLWLC